MNRSSFGHVATTILRQITQLGRIDAKGREKTMLVTESAQATDWASLTFVGERHVFDLRIEGDASSVAAAAAAIKDEIANLDVPMAGHFIAEIRAMPLVPLAILADGRVAQPLRIEALVLRD